MNRLFTLFIAGTFIASHALAQPAATVAPATRPASQPARGPEGPPNAGPTVAATKFEPAALATFYKRHQSFLEIAKKGGVDLLFLGDSITEGWNKAPELWKNRYGPMHVANFGISGDRVQHVLWRIENGELDGISPKVIVLMIGTNNTSNDKAGPIVEGVTKLIATIQAKTPASKILLLAIFPRARQGDTTQMSIVEAANKDLAKLDDGNKVRFLDINKSFLGTDGKVSHDLFPDYLHPNAAGYQIWADQMQPLLDSMMK